MKDKVEIRNYIKQLKKSLSVEEVKKRTNKSHLVTKKFLNPKSPEYLALADGDKKALKHFKGSIENSFNQINKNITLEEIPILDFGKKDALGREIQIPKLDDEQISPEKFKSLHKEKDQPKLEDAFRHLKNHNLFLLLFHLFYYFDFFSNLLLSLPENCVKNLRVKIRLRLLNLF